MNIAQFINPKGKGASIRDLPTATKIAALLVGLILVVTVVLVLRIGSATEQALIDREISEREATSRAEAVRLALSFSQKIDEFEAFSASEPVQTGLTTGEAANAEAQAALDAYRTANTSILAAALISQNDAVIALSGDSLPGSANSSKWVWQASLEDAASGDAFASGEISDDGLTGAEGLHLAIPVFANQSTQRIGTLYAVLDPMAFAPPPLANEAWIGVYDSEGNTILATDRFGNSIRSDVRDRLLNTPSGGALSTIGSSPYLYGFVHLNDIGLERLPNNMETWTLSVQEDANPTLAEISAIKSNLQRFVGISGAILALVTLAVVYFFSRSLIELAVTAEQIAATDELNINVPPGSSAYDSKMLSGGLQNLLKRLQYRARQLDAAAAVSRESVQREVRALLDQIAHTIHERLPYPEIYIYLMEPDGLRARVVAAYGSQGRNLLKVGTAVVLTEKQALGRGVLNKRTEWFNGVAAAFAGKNEEPAEVAIPFADAAGALHIIGNKAHAFAKPDVDMLELIGNEIGAIVENRRLFEEAEAAKEEAEQANRIKSQFLANMSHELRTPLNAILNFTGFVADGDVGPVNKEQKDLLDKVYQSGEHLLNLINDILDLSKIEAGMLQFLMEDVEVNRILDSTLSTAKGLVKQKPIELLSDIEDELPALVGDKRRLRQVFLNLVSNAIKFTNEGHVRVRAFNDNGSIHVMVEDTGAGIPPEDQHLVFETFRQAKHEFEVGGTGLGLSISKHFIEAHGGRIWFESVHHEGTTFHVTLPLKAAVDEMDTAAAVS